MWRELELLAESHGCVGFPGGMRLVEPGAVFTIERHGEDVLMKYSLLGGDSVERYQKTMTVDEAKGFLIALGQAAAPIAGHAQKQGDKKSYANILKKMDPEHWHRDDSIGNRYSLPQRSGAHSVEVIGKSATDQRVADLVGQSFWERPKLGGGYIDNFPEGDVNG